MALHHTDKIRAIITGSTGMVGEGVLLECLDNPEVEAVVVINRRPCGITHPKLREILQTDFFQLDKNVRELSGFNACFFCLGISSLGVSKDEYKHITYDLTLTVARVLEKNNPDMTFCYVTGAGTDSSEKGRSHWANVKGATENALLKLFRKSYMFRPGFMQATAGQKNLPSVYKYIAWLYCIGRKVYPAGFCTLKEIGKAMINVSKNGYFKSIIEVKDAVILAEYK